MPAATRGPADFPVNTGQNAASRTSATPGAGQFKGRDRTGGEIALSDAESGSIISGTEVSAMIIGLILPTALCAMMLSVHAIAERVSSTLAPAP